MNQLYGFELQIISLFLRKILVVSKKVVPLHPLSGNNLKISQKSSLKDLHRQRRE